MKFHLLNRKVHYWLSLAIALPAAVIFATGLLLQVKKQVAWVQPAEQRGSAAAPAISLPQMLESARAIPELRVREWADVARVEARPARGIVKVVSRNGWEAQLDASDGRVLQVARRRSDLIESLHDGSWFSGWVKNFVFLPTGIVLVVMWATGVYLFVLPYLRRR